MKDAIADVFNGIKGMTLKPNSSFSLEIETPDPLIEPNDMVIIEPPCHPNEPFKVHGAFTERAFCLVCGAKFAA